MASVSRCGRGLDVSTGMGLDLGCVSRSGRDRDAEGLAGLSTGFAVVSDIVFSTPEEVMKHRMGILVATTAVRKTSYATFCPFE